MNLNMNRLKGLMNRLWRRKKAPQHLFIDVLREYIDMYISENQLNDRTAEHYEARYRNIHLFLVSKGYSKYKLPDVRTKVMEELRSWLFLNTKTRSKRHPSLHVELCKRVMKYAVMREYTGQDWIAPVKSQRDRPKQIIHLTVSELRKLMVYEFNSDIYRIVAKMFAFQCFTGLSYCELFTYNLVEIKGRLWIDSCRDKTGRSEYVWLFDEAKELHNYFGGKIPNVPNQTCNRILKEIAGLLNINKSLTTHIGRKTHATVLDEYGVSTKTIARQLRNTPGICDTDYIAKSPNRTEAEMERLGLTGNMLLAG